MSSTGWSHVYNALGATNKQQRSSWEKKTGKKKAAEKHQDRQNSVGCVIEEAKRPAAWAPSLLLQTERQIIRPVTAENAQAVN